MKRIFTLVLVLMFCSCKKYLDIVPDNVATIEHAFTMRNSAEKFLFTCYSYLPRDGHYIWDPSVYNGDEMWGINVTQGSLQVAQGFQSVVAPLFDFWNGDKYGVPSLFMALRDCNIFLDNIDKTLDLTVQERDRWRSEVLFLKAYYHYYLLRMYGPIPLIRKNIPISASVEEVKVKREPVDDCLAYILELLDQSMPGLPERIESEATEQGRITQLIALSVKAKVLMLAASPLFNGNTDYANFTNDTGTPFFNQVYDKERWKEAADACKAAIDAAHQTGHKLYYYSENDANSALVSPETNLKMNIRNSVTARWNPEIIWGVTNNLTTDNQRMAQARLDGNTPGMASVGSSLAPTLKMAELFYTKNGVPIKEDKTWDYTGRFELRQSGVKEQYYIQQGSTTVGLHLDREPRFYASLAFDGSIWYGQGRKTEGGNWVVRAKFGEYSGGVPVNGYSATGYWPKKLVNAENVYSATSNYTIVNYPHPEIRLADLYLLYAEALNEYSGPGAAVYEYINYVRKRAGLKSVEESWSNYSVNSGKYQTQQGLREIIQQERAIELCFEGHRFYDLKRWKKAMTELNYRVQGWNILQSTAAQYYKVVTLHDRKFDFKDYFWPLRELDLIVNKNLQQNPGW